MWNDELGKDIDNSTTWNRIFDLIGDPIGQKEAVLCQQTLKLLINQMPKLLHVHLAVNVY